MNRRKFLYLTAGLPALTLSRPSCSAVSDLHQDSQNTATDSTTMQATAKFIRWVKQYQSVAGRGLYPYMAAPNAETLSTIASAKLLLFFIKQDDIASAISIADGLLYWLEQGKRQSVKLLRGGLPTEIHLNQTQSLGDYYYASDNLIAVHAFYALYQKTGQGKYADAANNIGKWLAQGLFNGVRHGMWSVNYGPPMHYLTKAGAFDNSIHTAGDFLWLIALKDLHALQPNQGWLARLAKAIDFMRGAQMPSGAWYTYFKPDKKSKSGTWYGYRGDDITIGDDNLRSALAAQQLGMAEQLIRFQHWLQPYQDTLLWGYLHTDKSTPKFLPSDVPYFDVVCTGLLRSLYHKLGRNDLAAKCQAQLNALQNSNGGWAWAVKQADLTPLNSEHAIITGCWALADIV